MPALNATSRANHVTIQLTTTRPTEFVDLTGRIEAVVGVAGLRQGLVNVQTRHTTAAIVVNEHDPQLLADFDDLLAGLAPTAVRYRHDSRAAVHPDGAAADRPNGHAHCRALLLPASACLNVVDARICLGPWQRVFLVELDGPREREVSVLCMGERRVREA